ncbi:MAG TPA: threonine/serine dehydratase [Micromonosporaceae bacterium]|jgi:threonine dehydratase|nr:threonine/serine dehydratase [Micromonosporaceae bacterium]
MPSLSDVAAAATRIDRHVRRTPVVEYASGVWLKCEYLQHTGSFKARGAFNRILAARGLGELDPAIGVVVASGGNAGLAIAYAARRLAVPAQVWVPTNAPAVKVAKLRQLGAEVILHGTEYADAHDAAVKRAAELGAVYCHAYDQPEIVAGQGTLALELPDCDTVVVAVGGGGLLAGIATALDGAARVVGVEPVTIPTLHRALAAGGPVDVAVSGIAADSLGARRVGDIAYAVAVRTGVRSVLVSDEQIVEARRALWEHWRIVVEHGAAAALAGLTCGAYVPNRDERVVVVLCGANTDPSDL